MLVGILRSGMGPGTILLNDLAFPGLQAGGSHISKEAMCFPFYISNSYCFIYLFIHLSNDYELRAHFTPVSCGILKLPW